MTAKRRLTRRAIEAMKPAATGARYDVWDTEVPGLLVRVTSNGVRTFMLSARYPGTKWSTRRALGTYPDRTLEKAREKARAWRQCIREGLDPAVEEEEARQAELRRQASTFRIAAEAFIAHTHGTGQRQAAKVERDMCNVFIAAWGKRPVTAITSADVKLVIDAKVKEGKRARAHNLLELISRCFNWLVDTDAYGLAASPCARLKPKKVIGEKKKRKRILSDDELRAFWAAAGNMKYPVRQFLRLLLVTIQRKSEVSDVAWPEVDLENGLWIIPAHRMKMDNSHAVPLSSLAVSLFREAPLFAQGPAALTYTLGKKPLNSFSAIKREVDALMLDQLRKSAIRRGEDPATVRLAPWVLHDLRRTGRTHLSALPVPDLIRERIIAHAPSGLHQTYDLFDHLEEKRRGLDLWAERLLTIVEPKSQLSQGEG